MGYDDQIAHPTITEYSVKNSALNNHLTQYLGADFINGFESWVSGKSVLKWIVEGSIAEDADACQRANHMHNPMNNIPWSSSYMSDDPWWTSACSVFWYKRYSNVTWATGFLAPAPDGQKTSYYSPTPQNWDVARNYYYLALTSDLYRALYFTKTFKTLGQVLHLLQDMAVPAHTRNDFTAHMVPGGEPYESYVQSNSELISASAPAMPAFDTTTLTTFWDTNKYDGTNPSAQSDIGLAEFTNANYFSASTIRNNGFENGLTPEHYFPYPYVKYSSSVGPSYQICAGMTDSGHEVQYISKKNGKPCPPPTDTAAIDHFAVMTLVNADTTDSLPTTMLFWLDDNVYRQYAKELLPRAVGYSAALINYFFRGTLEIQFPSSVVYSIADGSKTEYEDVHGNPHQQFTKLNAMIMNTTANGEAIRNGTLTAVARYKIIPEYASDLANYPPKADVMKAIPFTCSVSNSVEVYEGDIIPGYYTDFTFDFSKAPIPAGITDLTLQVVFKGTIGNEIDNAVAMGMKDLMEPTHLTFWNLSDMFSLQYPGSEYHLYTFSALQSMAQSNPSFLNWLDITPAPDGNESLDDELYLQPHTSKFTVSFWNGAEMIPALSVDVPPGAYIRPIVLTDQATNNWYELKWEDPVESDSVTLPFPGVVNQADPQTGQYGAPTTVYEFRKGPQNGPPYMPILQHDYVGIVGCKPDMGSVYCPYDEDGADPVPLTPVSFKSIFSSGS